MNEKIGLKNRCSIAYMCENLDEAIIKNIHDETFGNLLEKYKPIIKNVTSETEKIYSKTKSWIGIDLWLIPLLIVLPFSLGFIFELGTFLSIVLFFIPPFFAFITYENINHTLILTYKAKNISEISLIYNDSFKKLKTNSDDIYVFELDRVCYLLEQWIPFTYFNALDQIVRDKNNDYYHYSHFFHQKEFAEIKRTLFKFNEEREKADKMYESLIVDAYEEFVVKKAK